jgi:endonuclease YncB( thermonuclease family)
MPIAALLALAAGTPCHSLSVHDGDTIRCGAERIRIADIDAPELPDSPKCEDYRARYAWCDFSKGVGARDALRRFLAKGQVTIQRQGFDRYGRTLALVRVNGMDAGEWLISKGLARRWN